MKQVLIAAAAALLMINLQVSAQDRSSWQVIQEEIFNKNCTVCHTEGSSFARQSGLDLSAGVAYENLVGARPKNEAAASDGLLRVSPVGGPQGEFLSFLLEKIDAPNQNHFYNDHPGYGQIMPLGLPYLTHGEIQFIRQWLRAGAPSSGVVVDESTLADTSRYEIPAFKPLEPPAQGFQLHLGPFEVWPAQVHDREFLYFQPFETAEDMFVTRYEISMRPGSHHFILYNYAAGSQTPTPEVYRDLRNQNGQLNFPVALQLGNLFPFQFFLGTQTPHVNYHFPEGVALRLPAGQGFDLNSHSVNRSGETQNGEVIVNVHTIDREQVVYVADYDNFGNNNINLPPNRVTTLSREFAFDETRSIIQMWTHAHEHMVEFSIWGVAGAYAGELLYWTNDWEHPPVLELDPPLVFHQGDKIKLETTYNNDTDQTITYGPLSSDEMQFLFYIYYRGEATTNVAESPGIPSEFSLAQNYPNPFKPEGSGQALATEFTFTVPVDWTAPVTLRVYDITGQLVNTLIDRRVAAGTHTISWDGRNHAGAVVPTGVYFYQVISGEFKESHKMLLAK